MDDKNQNSQRGHKKRHGRGRKRSSQSPRPRLKPIEVVSAVVAIAAIAAGVAITATTISGNARRGTVTGAAGAVAGAAGETKKPQTTAGISLDGANIGDGAISGVDAHAIPTHDTPDTTPLDFPFNAMSMDWGDEDLDGWWHYELPEDYTRTGGHLPDLVQVYTYCLCKQNDVPYSLILAMIEVESGYRWDVVSSEGAVGYLQIIPRFHSHRLPAGSGDLTLINPYTNIRIGIEYLVELMGRFDNLDFVLSAYQYGVSGAYKNTREDGGSAYADRVLEIKDRIETQLAERAAERAARQVIE